MPLPNWISDFFSPPLRGSCLRELFTGGNHSGRVYLLQFSAARAWVSGLSRREPHKNWLPCCAFLHYALLQCSSKAQCCALLHCADPSRALSADQLLFCSVSYCTTLRCVSIHELSLHVSLARFSCVFAVDTELLALALQCKLTLATADHPEAAAQWPFRA